MNNTPFQAFLELIKVDQLIEGINKQVARLNDEIAVLDNQKNKMVADLDATSHAVHDAQKAVDSKELDMRTLDGREKEKKHRLENVSGHKEYQSLKSELDAISKQQQELEVVLLEVWHTLETKKKDYEALKASTHTQQIELDGSLKTKEAEKVTLLEQIENHTQERNSKEHNVPQEWLEKYVLMRARVPDPVVPVLNGSCSACFYKVNEQDMQELRRRKLLQCKDCYRFLYLETV